MATIYILEDDLNIQEIEAYALKNSGYQTEGFAKKFQSGYRVFFCLILCFRMPMDWMY